MDAFFLFFVLPLLLLSFGVIFILPIILACGRAKPAFKRNRPNRWITPISIFLASACPLPAQTPAAVNEHLACLKEVRLVASKSLLTAMAKPLGGWERLSPDEKAFVGNKALEDAQRLMEMGGVYRSLKHCQEGLRNVRAVCREDKTCE